MHKHVPHPSLFKTAPSTGNPMLYSAVSLPLTIESTRGGGGAQPTMFHRHSLVASHKHRASIVSSISGSHAGIDGDGDVHHDSSPFHHLDFFRSSFEPNFEATRAALDYSWHKRYSQPRTQLQDRIIRRMLRQGRQLQLEQPWAVFTAGCMGAGKTHVLDLLGRSGLLPLSSFVHIDLDCIRTRLPETAAAMRRDLSAGMCEAGTLTQQEAGMIAEITTEEAFKRGRLVYVDSSLRDAAWWSDELQRLKSSYPRHRFALFHISASWSTVVSRAAGRAKQTGRVVPCDLLADSFDSVPRAVSELRHLFDECILVDNDGDHPRLLRVEDVEALARLSEQLYCETVRARWKPWAWRPQRRRALEKWVKALSDDEGSDVCQVLL
mmetsp:Transcript_40328/g.66986  ORF Transcript_40328/g.66986 Transcript_40328/m.66986 type:complete len:380 (-) Transcript_40328:147-1286(-)